jgi:single-strand DNA-binding protein
MDLIHDATQMLRAHGLNTPNDPNEPNEPNERRTMMLTTTTLFQGNLTADPKPHRTAGGTAVADFRVLVSHRVQDRDEQWIDAEPTGHNVRVYGRLAEAVIDQLVKGSRVIVVGRTETDAWGDPDTGEKRTTTRVIVDRHGAIGRALNTAPTTDVDDHDQADKSGNKTADDQD